MFQPRTIATADKATLYRDLADSLRGLLAGEPDAIANAANMSALLHDALPDLNWVGFYFLRAPDMLVVGPFQGKPACVRIPVGRGVCGTAVERRASILVEDVHAFPGHIACDAASRSELVVPLVADGAVVGVLDLDSPLPARFDEHDRTGIEALAAIWVEASDLSPFARLKPATRASSAGASALA